jgi:GR25 family glycosyltransferase involved in LPS biosynthesis
MEQLFKKILLILLLVILIIIILSILNKSNKLSNILVNSENHINASFVSDEYLKNIKNKPEEVKKYKMHFLSNSIEGFESLKEPKFIKKIDKILYINLKHRKDRKRQIENELKKMSFPKNKIKRVDATLEKYNGHIGCCKSHIKVMNEIIKNNHKYTIVFEDDFVFSVDQKTLDKKINGFFEKYGDNWDMIQLASVYTTLDDTNNKFIKKVKKASTSSAYIINRPFAELLLKDLKNSLNLMHKDMDRFNKKNNGILKKKTNTPHALDQHWYNLQSKSRWYLFKPYLGKQGGTAGASSIMSGKLEAFTNNIRLHKINV